MRHHKRKARRCRGGLRDAIVGVRHFDSSLFASGYLAVWSLLGTRFGRAFAPPGLLMFRACCVVELRPVVIEGIGFTDIYVTHLDGEVRIRSSECFASLARRIGVIP